MNFSASRNWPILTSQHVSKKVMVVHIYFFNLEKKTFRFLDKNEITGVVSEAARQESSEVQESFKGFLKIPRRYVSKCLSFHVVHSFFYE